MLIVERTDRAVGPLGVQFGVIAQRQRRGFGDHRVVAQAGTVAPLKLGGELRSKADRLSHVDRHEQGDAGDRLRRGGHPFGGGSGGRSERHRPGRGCEGWGRWQRRGGGRGRRRRPSGHGRQDITLDDPSTGPLPRSALMSTPCSAASLRASGEATMRSPPPGTAICAGLRLVARPHVAFDDPSSRPGSGQAVQVDAGAGHPPSGRRDAQPLVRLPRCGALAGVLAMAVAPAVALDAHGRRRGLAHLIVIGLADECDRLANRDRRADRGDDPGQHATGRRGHLHGGLVRLDHEERLLISSATESPSCSSHSVMVPSSIVRPRIGMITSKAMGSLRSPC